MHTCRSSRRLAIVVGLLCWLSASLIARATGLVTAEAFLDNPATIPGTGTTLSLSNNGSVGAALGSLDLTGVTPGMHTLYLRFRDDAGDWSQPIGQSLQITSGNPGNPLIGGKNRLEAVEAFIDNDPGEGRGTSLNIPLDGSIDSTFEIVKGNLDLRGLGLGVHTLNVRYLDSTGLWSAPLQQTFYIPALNPLGTLSGSSQLVSAIGVIDQKTTKVLAAEDGKFDDIVETVTLSAPVSSGYHSGVVRFVDFQGISSFAYGDPPPMTFKDVASLAGQVIDKGTGLPLAGVQVWVGGGFNGVSDANGFYTIKPLPLGSAPVATLKAGYNSYSTTLNFTGSSRLDIALDRDFSQCTAIALSGVVRDGASKTTLSGIQVQLGSSSATTDQNGLFTIGNLTAGVHELTVPKQLNYLSSKQKVSICDGSPQVTYLTKAASTNSKEYPPDLSADPVNLATGNYTFQRTDLKIPGIGIGFEFSRGYNSQNPQDGPLGFGWTHNFAVKLVQSTENVEIYWGDGSLQTFVSDGNGFYTPQPGVTARLIRNNDGSWSLQKKDHMQYFFDSAGILQTISDLNGNTQTLGYSGGKLAQVTDTAGRVITFIYDTANRIIEIHDPLTTPRKIIFTYSASGDLISSKDARGEVTGYSYDALHQMLTATDPRGNVFVRNVYDAANRVVTSQKDAKGANTTFQYDESNRRTIVTDPLGQQAIHYHDENLRLIRAEDPLGSSIVYSYENGNRTSILDKNGFITRYTYDARGNVTSKVDALGNFSVIVYDADDNPLTRTDSAGNITGFSYDDRGNLVESVNPLGYTSRFSYSPNGLLQSSEDALGELTSYTYNIYGDPTMVTDPLGMTQAFSYDIVGRRLSATNAHNFTTYWTYDNNDNVLSIKDPLGYETRSAYDGNNNRINLTDGLGNVTNYEYDAKDLLAKITDAAGNIRRIQYDALDRKIEETDARGGLTTYEYDAVGNLVKVTNPLGASVTSTFDKNGKQITSTDALGNTTTFIHDELGRTVLVADALGNETSTEYDALGRKIAWTDPRGNTTRQTYDAIGNLLSVTDGLGNVTDFTYDVKNNLLTATNPLGQTSIYQYDALNRKTRTTDPLGNVEQFTYDALGQRISSTNAKGQVTEFAYDKLKRLAKVTDPASGEMNYTYDANGNRLTLSDPKAQVTSYTYDVLNRRISQTEALGNVTLYSYDPIGNVIGVTDPNEATTSYTYDAANRLIKATYPDSLVSFTYDANNNRLTMVDSLGTTTYTYDTVNRLTGVTDPFGKSVGYGYDAASNRIVINYPGGKAVNYSYDALNRLTSLTDWLSNTTSYAYDAAGRLAGTTNPNSTNVEYTYDAASRLTGLLNQRSDASIIAGYSYTLDKIGNHVQVSENQPLTPVWGSTSTDHAHDSENRLISQNTAALTYDDNGNLIGQGSDIFAYDHQNRLISSQVNGKTCQYAYNGLGNRYQVTSEGVSKQTIWDINQKLPVILAETNGGGVISSYYVYGLGLVSKVLPDNTVYTYHYDSRGSTIAITDSNGSVANSYAFDGFGSVQSRTVNVDNPFVFLGRYGIVDDGNGLNYIRARYYKSGIKRFITKDANAGTDTSSQTWNRYMYSLGNPLNLADISGFSPIESSERLINYYVPTNSTPLVQSLLLNDKTYNFSSLFVEKVAKKSILKATTYFLKDYLNTIPGGWTLNGDIAWGVYQSIHYLPIITSTLGPAINAHRDTYLHPERENIEVLARFNTDLAGSATASAIGAAAGAAAGLVCGPAAVVCSPIASIAVGSAASAAYSVVREDAQDFMLHNSITEWYGDQIYRAFY